MSKDKDEDKEIELTEYVKKERMREEEEEGIRKKKEEKEQVQKNQLPNWTSAKGIGADLSNADIFEKLKNKYEHRQDIKNENSLTVDLKDDVVMTLDRKENSVSLNKFDESSVRKMVDALKDAGIKSLDVAKLSKEDRDLVGKAATGKGLEVKGYKAEAEEMAMKKK